MVMPLPDTGPTNAFYDAWSNYLHPYPRIWLSMMQQLGQMCMSAIYNISSGAYTAWQKAWGLLDFSTLFTGANGSGTDASGLHLVKLIPIFLVCGLILWGIVMAVQVFEFTATSGKKGREWPMGFVTIIICLGFAPILMTGGTQIARAMNSEIMSRGSDTNPMLEMLKNNSVDLKKVGQQNFNVKEKDFNQYSPVGKNADDGTVNDPVFTAVMSDDSAKKGLNSRQAKKVFIEKKGDDGQPVKLDKGSWVTGGTMAEEYPRVKVNWVGVIAGFAAFGFAVFLAIIELLLRFYRLAAYSIMMLYFAFRDAGGKRAIQIMQLLEGSLTGLALMPLSVMLFFGFMQFGMTKIGEMNLSWWPFTLLSIGLILAGTKGLLSGFSLIDQWTGVPSGQGSALQAAGSGALAAAGAAKLGAAGAKTVGGITAAGTDLIDKAHESGQQQSKKLADWMDKNGEPGDDYSAKDASDDLEGKMKNDSQGSESNQKDTGDTSNSQDGSQENQSENGSVNDEGGDNSNKVGDDNHSDSNDSGGGAVPENDTEAPEFDGADGVASGDEAEMPDNDTDVPDSTGSEYGSGEGASDNEDSDIPENDTEMPDLSDSSNASGNADIPENDMDVPNLSESAQQVGDDTFNQGEGNSEDMPLPNGDIPRDAMGAEHTPETSGNPMNGGNSVRSGASQQSANSSAMQGNQAKHIDGEQPTQNNMPNANTPSTHSGSGTRSTGSENTDAASEMFPIPDVGALFGKDSNQN